MLTLLPQQTVHGGVITNDDVVLHVTLGGGEAELDEGDLGVLELGGASGGFLGSLVEDDSVDELQRWG